MEMKGRRQQLYELLGDLPPRNLLIQSEKLGEETHPGFVVESWVFDWNGEEPVKGYFVRPQGKQGPFPTLLFNHSHGGNYQLGKDELLEGNVYLQSPSYATELAKIGYASFSIDAWGFGSRSSRAESELFKEMLWKGEVLWGKMVYDTLRAVDYLSSRKDVDENRLGTIGMSMGSVMSWWIAALDQRMKVCVDICGLVDFHELIENRALDLHGIYFYVPGLLKHFTTTEINALIAPRPHLALAGTEDKLVPTAGLDKIEDNLRQIYSKQGKPEAWQLFRFHTGHAETEEMRKEAMKFLRKWL